MGAGDCGSADDQSRWFKNLGQLGNFKLSTNRPPILSDSQTPNQPAGHSVRRPDFQPPHALANRSGIFLLRLKATEDEPPPKRRIWSADTKVYL